MNNKPDAPLKDTNGKLIFSESLAFMQRKWREERGERNAYNTVRLTVDLFGELQLMESQWSRGTN